MIKTHPYAGKIGYCTFNISIRSSVNHTTHARLWIVWRANKRQQPLRSCLSELLVGIWTLAGSELVRLVPGCVQQDGGRSRLHVKRREDPLEGPDGSESEGSEGHFGCVGCKLTACFYIGSPCNLIYLAKLKMHGT